VKTRQDKSLDPQEVELKFQLPPGSRAALELSPTFAAAHAKQHRQVTTYFDTPDGLLDEAGLTLRVRRTGNTRIQTVKSRSSGRGVATSRSEWEWPIDQDVPDVGRLAETRALAKAAKAIKGKLEPVFVTDIRRTIHLLHLDDNTVVEAANDEGIIKAGAAREPVSELELELKAGCTLAMYRLAAELQTLAPMWISPESKAGRGWQLRTGQTEGALVDHVAAAPIAAGHDEGGEHRPDPVVLEDFMPHHERAGQGRHHLHAQTHARGHTHSAHADPLRGRPRGARQ